MLDNSASVMLGLLSKMALMWSRVDCAVLLVMLAILADKLGKGGSKQATEPGHGNPDNAGIFEAFNSASISKASGQ